MILESNKPESVHNENQSEVTTAQAFLDVIVVGAAVYPWLLAENPLESFF